MSDPGEEAESVLRMIGHIFHTILHIVGTEASGNYARQPFHSSSNEFSAPLQNEEVRLCPGRLAYR
jgi:hypothetical protein